MNDRRTVGAVTASRRELEIRNEIEALLVRFQDVASPRIVADELWNSIVGPALDKVRWAEMVAELEQLRESRRMSLEINQGWVAYRERTKARRRQFLDTIATLTRERDALKTSVLAAMAEARRWWEGDRTMGEVREGLALEAVEAQLRAALPEAS